MDINTFLRDMRTYRILRSNNNYRERLLEAYNELKRRGINSLEEFALSQDLIIGAFGYDEITIFDRIARSEYIELLTGAWDDLHNLTEEYINDPHIGDKLASWGTLGETPYR